MFEAWVKLSNISTKHYSLLDQQTCNAEYTKLQLSTQTFESYSFNKVHNYSTNYKTAEVMRIKGLILVSVKRYIYTIFPKMSIQYRNL